MKKVYFACILLVSAVLISCKKNDNSIKLGNKLGIDIQSSFNQDRVEVLIDGQTVLDKKLSTNHLLGICWPDGQTSLLKDTGKHEIKVIVNESTIKTDSFILKDSLFIGVNYGQETDEIFLVYSEYPFGYD